MKAPKLLRFAWHLLLEFLKGALVLFVLLPLSPLVFLLAALVEEYETWSAGESK